MIAKVKDALGGNKQLILTDHNGVEMVFHKNNFIYLVSLQFRLPCVLKIYFDSDRNFYVAS